MDTNTERLCYMALRAGQLLGQGYIDFSHEEEIDGSLMTFFQQAVDEYAAREETEYEYVPFEAYAEQTLMDQFSVKEGR